MNKEEAQNIVRQYEELEMCAEKRITEYASKYIYRINNIDPYEIRFDFEKNHIEFNYYSRSECSWGTIPLDCLFTDEWERVAQEEIEKLARIKLEKEKKRREEEKEMKKLEKERELEFLKNHAQRLGYQLVKDK